jgi:ubiquinone/menaquinone biosynthesis C-methylase UbiE
MSVFESLYANQYDSLYKEKDYSGECDLVEESFKRFGKVGGTLLDIGCGTGTHSIELARRGYACTGVDLAPAMLEHAASKTASETFSHQPLWLQGDARTFEAGDTYDNAIMMFAVISYLASNDDVLAGLKNIRRHLKPGALFVCDFWYGAAVLSVRPNERVRILETPKGRTMRAASTTVDSFAQTADVSFKLWSVEGDKFIGETNETHTMRYFFAQEFKLLLLQSGFECLHLSAFPELDTPLTDDSWNAFCISTAV